jgi:hypothetical protein
MVANLRHFDLHDDCHWTVRPRAEAAEAAREDRRGAGATGEAHGGTVSRIHTVSPSTRTRECQLRPPPSRLVLSQPPAPRCPDLKLRRALSSCPEADTAPVAVPTLHSAGSRSSSYPSSLLPVFPLPLLLPSFPCALAPLCPPLRGKNGAQKGSSTGHLGKARTERAITLISIR